MRRPSGRAPTRAGRRPGADELSPDAGPRSGSPMPPRPSTTSSSRRVDPAAGSTGITAFLVATDTPGFRFGAHEHKMGIRCLSGDSELVFDDCEVPVRTVWARRASGYRIALSALGEGRISIAAACVGLARSGLEAAARYLGGAAGVRGAAVDAAGSPVHAGRDGPRRGGRASADACRGRARGTAASHWPRRRRSPSGPRRIRPCASRPMPSSCSGRAATRARPASSA